MILKVLILNFILLNKNEYIKKKFIRRYTDSI